MGLEPRDYRKKPLKVFIAIGHGGSDPGAVYGGWVEKHINQNIAMLMEADLRRHGVQVRLSRYVDEEDRLVDEIAECNEYEPDFAVEIHTNAGGGTGFEVYYQMEPWVNGKISAKQASECKYPWGKEKQQSGLAEASESAVHSGGEFLS